MSDQKTENRDFRAPGGSFPFAGRAAARVGYGMGQVTRRAESQDGHADAIALLRRALELGINHFDTAQFYGNGLANRLLHEALGDRRDELVIATKVGAKPVPGAQIPLTAAQKPAELRAAVEANLRALDTDRIDVVNLRRMDFLPGLRAEGDQVVPFEDQLAEMITLRGEGKILAIGLSHVTLDQLLNALSGPSPACRTSTTWSTVPPNPSSTSASKTESPRCPTSHSAAASAPFPRSRTRLPSRLSRHESE